MQRPQAMVLRSMGSLAVGNDLGSSRVVVRIWLGPLLPTDVAFARPGGLGCTPV